ncbi:MAG: hypothetical protein VXW25_04720 [Pseudomonadota bacterium]|nr:hypothetical protein [Pseudomonadota bacterium]
MMMKSFGPLTGIYTAPARGGTPSSLIVIMHGWGADAQDLADLAYPMSLRFPGAAFFVPNAPEPCSMNPMGRQWFDLADTAAGPALAGKMIEESVAAATEEQLKAQDLFPPNDKMIHVPQRMTVPAGAEGPRASIAPE